MLPLYFLSSRRILAAAAVSTMLLLITGVFLYQAHAETLTYHPAENTPARTSSSGAVYLSPESAPIAAATIQKAPILEVHIANNGLVLLRGARVIAISGSTIRVGMTWGLSDFTWAVKTNFDTKFLTSKGERGNPTDIEVGDIVTVTGDLIASGEEPTINAEFVRE